MADRERVGRFLRTLLGFLTLAWLVVAVLAPPNPFTFLLWLVPAWGLALIAAVALELTDGYRRLRTSRFYAPGVEASTATVVFVASTLVLKAGLTLVADLVLGGDAVGYREGVVTGFVALVVAYLLVFRVGAVGWVVTDSGSA